MTTGTVIQFRRGRKTYKPRHFLIEVEGLSSRDEAKALEGKKVSWTSTGKEAKVIKGVISSAHGNKGVLRAIFERGLPGQAIGTEVEIEGELKNKPAKKEAPKKTEKKEEKKESIVEKVEDAVEEAVEDVKEGVEKAVDKVKEVAEDVVEKLNKAPKEGVPSKEGKDKE